MVEELIDISTPSQKDLSRRRRELILALGCFGVIALLTYVELRFIGVNSYLFLGLFNLNFILLLLVLFLVTRNAVKLILERRRNVLGSKLRTRLVLALISLSIIPTLLMFLLSVKFVQTSVDYWFKAQVEDSMVQALDLGRAFYASAQKRLERRGKNMIADIRAKEFAWGGKAMDRYLDEKYAEYDLALLGVVTPEGKDQNQHAAGSWDQAWREIKERIDWEALKKTPGYWSTLLPTPSEDLIVGMTPVDEGRTGYLLLGESIGEGLLYKLDQVVRGLDDYKKLKTLKYPWKMTLYLTLGVMTLLIILGAIWFGFRVAKELSEPVQALAAGTERVARGDLSVRLEDRSDDEIGFLVRSFNRMTEDLAQSRASLQTANLRLAQQNQELEQRGRYIEAVLDNITAGVVSMDAEGRIGTVNKAAEAMLGIDARTLIGKQPLALLRNEFAELLREALEQMAVSPSSQWQRQIDLTIRGRHVRLLVNVVALSTEQGADAGTVAVFEDITELEKIQRLAAWREVARRIAHEIKNPLTPIKLSAQRLQRRFEDLAGDQVFDECTKLIVRQVERLQQMVTEFSSYAKLPEAVPKPDFLAPVLEEVVALFETSHRQIAWKMVFKTPIQELPFDREGLRRVFINLLTNAAEALEGRDDGEVVVTAAEDRDAGRVRVAVADNGPGFSPQESARMFEPYFSSKKGGTGLGLTIVRSIINDHKGRISVAPNSPTGSVFIVELPAG
ncbi:MAG: PAS domain S-box protein [Desulfovibrionaceae bacterium]|nr:PAS domain S-box protein [Desulfovibrionaceae bacterium]